MEIKLLAFGQISEIMGQAESDISVQDTDDLRVQLTKQYPVLVKTQFAIAVNKKIIQENTVLNDGDTVALLPPFFRRINGSI